jgi:hypothetical protein
MREFVFDIVYDERGPLEELFDGEPVPSSTGLGGCLDADEFWRIERFHGPQAALDGIETDRLYSLLDIESITPAECSGSIHVEVLERGSRECEVYYHIDDFGGCDSVATLAVEYLGPDVLFEVEREQGRETWALVTETDDGVGLLYDALQAALRPNLRFEFSHVGEASDRRTDLFATENLPAEQREALVAAVEQGYYETPRQVTLDELAAALDWPRSTLSYRLRRAEAQLAKTFAFTTEAGGPRTLARPADMGEES